MKISHYSCASLLLLLTTPLMAAEMYKCEGEGGVPLYQNFPCPKGKEIRNMSDDEPTISVIPMKPEPSKLTSATTTPPPPATPQTAPPATAPVAAPAQQEAIAPPPAAQEPRPPLVDLTQTPVVNVPEGGLPPQTATQPAAPPPLLTPTLPQDLGTPISPADLVPLTSGEAAPAAATPEIGAAGQARMAITAGMNEADVEAKLGPPPMVAADPSAPDQPKRWFYLPVEGDKDTITTITLQHGKVTQVERKPVKK